MTAADLLYDPETHTSRTPDGRDVPHVTAVLSAVGLTTDFDELALKHPRIAEHIRQATARGSAVHADCHAYDDEDLVWSAVDARVLGYVEAWTQVRADLGLMPLARERRLYHPTAHYTGIMDGVFSRAALNVLVDIKTGDPDDAAAHLQTAAYEDAYLVTHPGAQIDERWAIWLRPGLRVPYRVINYTARPDAWLDLHKWQAALAVYNEQPARRRRVA